MEAPQITSNARKGAAWSLIIACIAFPLPFVRTLLLGEVDPTEHARGYYALILLFLQGIYALFLPGGRAVFPAFYPKLSTDDERSRFVSGYLFLTFGMSALAILVFSLWPSLLDLLLRQQVDRRTRLILRALIPFILFSTLSTSIVMSHMSFVWAAFLQRAQIVCVTVVLGAVYLTGSSVIASDPLLWLGGTIAFAAAVTMAVSSSILLCTIRIVPRPKFPRGCFRFVSVAYLDAIMLLAYNAIDQYVVAYCFGVAELGRYVPLLLLARIAPLTMQQIGHLLLTTFSKLLGADAEATLITTYRRISRLTVGFYAAITLCLVLFSHPLAALFGEACAAEHKLLICLAVAMNIDSLRTINGMTLMAYERMHWVFFSKLSLIIVQLGLTIALIEPLGIYGVVLAKGAGHVVQTAVLFVATARVRRSDRLLPPGAYFVGQGVVLASGWIAMQLDGMGIGWSAAMLAGGSLIVWFGGRFRVAEVRAMMPRRWRGGEVRT